MHKEKDYECADGVSEKKRGEQSGCPVQMGKFLTCSEVRDTLIVLLERRVERRRGDLVQE